MAKWLKWTLIILLILAVVTVAVLALGMYIPYHQSENYMPEKAAWVMTQKPDGAIHLSWNGSDTADCHRFRILQDVPGAKTEEESQRVIYESYVSGGNQIYLPALPENVLYTYEVYACKYYDSWGQPWMRFSENGHTMQTTLQMPTISDLTWETDPEEDISVFRYELAEGTQVQCTLTQSSGSEPLCVLTENEKAFTFGEGAELPLPARGDQYIFTFFPYRQKGDLTQYGYSDLSARIVREDLLGRDLKLQCQDLGHNQFRLSWVETKGDYFEVQRKTPSAKNWSTVCQVQLDEPLTYTTPHLPVFREYSYRVLAVGGQTLPDSEYAAISDGKDVATKESPIFTTIWPTAKLKAYSDTAKTTEVGKVTTGKAYCVLDEKDGMFAIRLNGETAYIDANLCLINLPEYMGDLCSYWITKSFATYSMIHEYYIPEVTDEIAMGYENIQLADGTYLVPLLYPAAQKLVTAAHAAREQGYNIKIYDAFRPNIATKNNYELTEKILDMPIPLETHTGVDVTEDLPEPVIDPETELPLITYRMVMTDGKYSLSNFLAKGVSSHNYGIALDLTLEKANSGEELQMQTSIHDLSHHSVVSNNNKNAKLLAKIMTGAGFGTLSTEWWHFQDNEAKKAYKPSYVANGVNAACWMADDNGWRYRTKAGRFYADRTVTISGTEYTFDEKGYVIENK